MSAHIEALADVSCELEAKIAALLAGHDPVVQGSVLACLTATWLTDSHSRCASISTLMLPKLEKSA